MEEENTDKFIEEKNFIKIANFNINNSSKLRLGGSQDNILNRNINILFRWLLIKEYYFLNLYVS